MVTKVKSGVIADNSVGIDQLNVSDGSNGQALTTNGSGTLSFSTVGVSGISSSADATAITIDSNENVLIGASSANTGGFGSVSPQLLVAGTMPQVALHETDTDKDGYIGISGSVMFMQTADDIPIRFGQNDAEVMRIDTDGRLAINNATSAADSDINDQVKLVCGGGAVVGSSAQADNSLLQYTDAGGLTVLQGSGTYGLRIFDDNATLPRFTVLRSGAVGIGVSAPTSPLSLVVGANYNPPGLGSSGGHFSVLKIDSGTTGQYGLLVGVTGNGHTWFQGQRIDGTATAYNIFQQPSGGNVGIGLPVTDTVANKLQVDVDTAGAGTDSISVQNSGVSSANHTAGLRFQFNTAVPSAIRSLLTNTSNGAGTLSFFTSSDGTAGNLSERMRIDSSGDVQIGTTSQISNAKVSIYEASTDAGLFIRKGDGTQSSTNTYIHFDISGGGTAGGKITFASGGSAQFTATSDERLKENIEDMTGCLDKVMALKPSSFTLKENKLDVPYGFIAQNVETVLPQFVSEDENGYKQISDGLTSGYIAVLTKAIQELAAEVEELKTKLESK